MFKKRSTRSYPYPKGRGIKRFFTGPVGPIGCAGDPGEPGYLQLSGFPQGHELCLFDHNKRLVWSVMIGHGTAKVRKFRRYRT